MANEKPLKLKGKLDDLLRIALKTVPEKPKSKKTKPTKKSK